MCVVHSTAHTVFLTIVVCVERRCRTTWLLSSFIIGWWRWCCTCRRRIRRRIRIRAEGWIRWWYRWCRIRWRGRSLSIHIIIHIIISSSCSCSSSCSSMILIVKMGSSAMFLFYFMSTSVICFYLASSTTKQEHWAQKWITILHSVKFEKLMVITFERHSINRGNLTTHSNSNSEQRVDFKCNYAFSDSFFWSLSKYRNSSLVPTLKCEWSESYATTSL